MKNLLEVCLLGSVLVAGMASPNTTHAQSPAVPQLRPGISVDLPITAHAKVIPEADQENATVITVTHDGGVYLGVQRTAPGALTEQIRGLQGSGIYIKGDAYTAFSNVAAVLSAVHTAGFTVADLLASQRDPSDTEPLVSPKGLEVVLHPSGPVSATIQLLNPKQLQVNGVLIDSSNLEAVLGQIQNRQKELLLQAEKTVPFGDVMKIIDLCSKNGFTVNLAL